MMELRLFCVLTLCIWLGQTCAGNGETIAEQKQIIRDQIYDVSEQFVDDFVTIREQFQDNVFIKSIFEQIIPFIAIVIPTEQNSKINVNQVKAYYSKFKISSVLKTVAFDYLRVSQLLLSKQLPPERYNGVVNLFFVCSLDYATTEEIQSALNYLYGIDTEATKTSFLDSHNVPNLTRVAGNGEFVEQ